MATRLGAGRSTWATITGSIEVGKRADLILIDMTPLHNLPKFDRDPNAVYSQIVYAAKSTDVADVMCNGRWLMRDRRLLTLDEAQLHERRRARSPADRRVPDRARGKRAAEADRDRRRRGARELRGPGEGATGVGRYRAAGAGSDDITIIRAAQYHQFDTYFFFDDPTQGHLRYREDEFLDEEGERRSARAPA